MWKNMEDHSIGSKSSQNCKSSDNDPVTVAMLLLYLKTAVCATGFWILPIALIVWLYTATHQPYTVNMLSTGMYTESVTVYLYDPWLLGKVQHKSHHKVCTWYSSCVVSSRHWLDFLHLWGLTLCGMVLILSVNKNRDDFRKNPYTPQLASMVRLYNHTINYMHQ